MRIPPSRHQSSQQSPNIPILVLGTLLFFLFTATFSSRTQTTNYADDIRYHMLGDDIFDLPVTVNKVQHNIPIVKYMARQPIVKGLTIIIGDVQADGYIDTELLSLAKSLPDWGWNTLLIMPQSAYFSPSANKKSEVSQASELVAETNESGSQNTLNGDANDQVVTSSEKISSPQMGLKSRQLQAPYLPYSQQDYIEFIGNVTNELKRAYVQGSGYQMIYAKGQSASAAIGMLSKENKDLVHALVVDNPYWPSMHSNQLLPKQLAALPLPVLDLISLSDNKWSRSTIQIRRNEAKVGLKSLYRQREVFTAQTSTRHYDHRSKELISWTYFLGW